MKLGGGGGVWAVTASSWKFTFEILEGFGLMTNDDERGRGLKCQKFDDVICERPITGRSASKLCARLNPGRLPAPKSSYLLSY